MKKAIPYIAAGLAVLLVILLMVLPRRDVQDRVTFYYARTQYGYGQEDGVMGAEIREVGHRGQDLAYLLALYLEGPLDAELQIPFPGKNIEQIQTLTMDKGRVHIVLPDMSRNMTDGQFSLSCACLTRTCLEITGADTVTITSGDRTVTMKRDNLLLFDESTSVEKPKTEEHK